MYIYVHMQVATTARVYLAGRKNSGRGGGTNASRGFTRRDLLPQSAASYNKHLAILFVMEEGFFFFFIFDLKNREMEILERGGEDFYFYGI